MFPLPPSCPVFECCGGGDAAKQVTLLALLKKVCRKAYFTSQKGYHLKAVKMMNESYVPQNHDLYCRVKAHLCLQVFVSQDNEECLSLKDKYKYLKEAQWFAQMAILYNPHWMEYVYFYAGLLYCRYIYDLLVQPSGRPLEIKSRLSSIETYCHPPEHNIAGVQQGLCDLVINECRNFSGNNIGRRIKEHELEDYMVSRRKKCIRWLNEIEKALRIRRKRRKELKVKRKAPVRVPAAAELIRSCRQLKSGLLVVRSDCQQKCVLPQRITKCGVSDFRTSIPCQVR